MMATQVLQETTRRLNKTLKSCVSLFREGEDNRGLDALMCSVEDLERILDILECTEETAFETPKMLNACRELLEYMEKRDVIGMTDLLEFTIIPLSETWTARCDAICR
ncbi:MAG: hypothetical protein VB035_11800 [Candidatus Fimivivens sp.]|nr:hypothetical protein [Candidatus Fimivivens sp.]